MDTEYLYSIIFDQSKTEQEGHYEPFVYLSSDERIKARMAYLDQQRKSDEEANQLIESYFSSSFLTSPMMVVKFLVAIDFFHNSVSMIDKIFRQKKLPSCSARKLVSLTQWYSFISCFDEGFIFPQSQRNAFKKINLSEVGQFHAIQKVNAMTEDIRNLSRNVFLYFMFTENKYKELFQLAVEKAFYCRLQQEIETQMKKSPIGYNAFYFLEKEEKENLDNLMRFVDTKTRNLYLPEHYNLKEKEGGLTKKEGKDEELPALLWEQLNEIKDENLAMKVMQLAMDQKLNYLPEAVRNRFINVVEQYNTKMRKPPEELKEIRIDKLIKGEEGEETPLIEMLDVGIKNKPNLLTLRKQFEDEYGKTGVKILEFICKNPLRPKQTEIAKGVGCNPKTVSRYFRLFNKSNPNPILEICRD